MENRGTVNLEKGATFLLIEGILPQQRDKCSMTLAKNMHAKLLNSKCRACFDFISIMTYCLSVNMAYMAHIRKGCTLFLCRIIQGFSILITP